MKNYFFVGVLGLVIVAGSFALGLVVANGSGSTAIMDSPRVIDSDALTTDGSATLPIVSAQNSLQSIAELAVHDRFTSHFERTIALHGLLDGATTQDLLAHLKQSTTLGESLREEVQLAIIQRIASIDPTAALEAISGISSGENDDLHSVVYHEWAVLDLDQAIEHVSSLDPGAQEAAIESVLLSREDLSPERRREIARQLDIEWLAIEVMEQNSTTPTIQNPESEWTALVRRNNGNLGTPDNAQLRMMTHIARAWVLKDGVDAFDNLAESLSTLTSLQKISDLVVRRVADDDPRLAFELAFHMRSIGVTGLIDRVVSQWGRDDPLSALNTVSTLETKYLKGKLQTEVLQSWAMSDPNSLLSQVGGLPEKLQPTARSKALLSLAFRSPQEAAELIGEIEDRDSLDLIARAIATSWSNSDLASALRWIDNEESVAHNRDGLRTAAISGLARSDPQQAMQVALAQPLNEDGIGPEAEVINAMTWDDMDTAISMLPQVRDGKTRLEAYESVITFLTPPIGSETERAIDLFVELANEQDIPNRAFIVTNLAISEPRSLFDALDRFESMDFRRRVASSLLRFHEGDDVFTEEQVSILQETSQYQQESREAQRKEAYERIRELLEQERDSDESESD